MVFWWSSSGADAASIYYKVSSFDLKLAGRARVFQSSLLSATSAIALLALSHPSFAAPDVTTAAIASGQVSITQAGSITTVNQSSSKAIINWQSFSIAKGETVNFNQPGSSAAILNRVTGNEASVIAGTLHANGQVFLVNSAGVLINQGAQVNVGGLVASTLNITDQNFLAGKYTFEGNTTGSTASPAGLIVNQGSIRARDGGYVALLGHSVSNQGTISARLGTVAMAAGDKITLNFDGNSLIDVTIDQGTLNALVENKSLIKANGGRVILTARAADAILSAQVNNSGIIQAHTMAALMGDHGSGAYNGRHGGHGRAAGGHSHGYIHLGPLQQVSPTTADAGTAGASRGHRTSQAASGAASTGMTTYSGSITLLAQGGSVTNTGTLDASAPKTGVGGTIQAIGDSVSISGNVNASAAASTGGTIIVTGTDLTLTSTAALNANGTTGGTILVGGDIHGGADASQNFVSTAVANAATTTIAAGAVLSANGSDGNGGNIVVWSHDHTEFDGSISATGAGASGSGGFTEVSSHGLLDFTGSVNLASANRTAGTLLLDPFDVVISNGTDTGAASLTGADPTATSVINIATLIAALANANVTISTGAGTTDSNTGVVTGANITIADALSWATPHTLTLTAATDVDINAAVGWETGGGLTATATGGNVNVNAPITWSAGTLALNAGQNVYINGPLTATGSGSFAETNGTGTNYGGLAYGMYFATGQAGYTGQINISGTGTVAINGQGYTFINSITDLERAEANPASNYVLGSDIGNLSYSDLSTFGFGSTGTFTGFFNGFGHSLAVGPTTAFTIGSAVSVPSTVTSTNFVLTSSSDLFVNAPVSWSTGILTLQATNNIYVNAVMSATSLASFTANYGSGLNADGYTPVGLYTAQGTNGTFTGRIDILGTGSVWLNSQQYLVVNSVTHPIIQPNGDYVLGDNYSTSGFSSLAFTGNFNGFGHVVTMTSPTSGGKNAGGLFNIIDSAATISNIGVSSTKVVLLQNEGAVANTGVLANVNQGTVVNSFSIGVVSGTNWDVNNSGELINFGGLVGDNSGKIINSYSSVGLTGALESPGNMAVGGLVGMNEAPGKIYGSYASGNLITFDGYTGGLVGVNSGAVSSSYSTASFTILKADNVSSSVVSSVGGLVGWNTSTGTITNSYAVTTTTGIGVTNTVTTAARLTSQNDSLSTIAGFVYQNDGTISNAYSAGTLGVSTSSWSLAGFVYNNTGTIDDAYSAVTLLSANNATYASSFYNANSGTLASAYWDASLTGTATQAGGLAIGLSQTGAKDISNYTGFDPAYWASSADGHPILRTIPIYVVPVANSAIEYGSDGAAIKSGLTVRGLQWGDTVSSLTFDPAAGLESPSGYVNAGTYGFSQLFSSNVYTNVTGSIAISPKVLTLSATGIVSDKGYDATIGATIDVTAANSGLVGLVGNETLGVSYSNAYFLDKNAGTGKTVDLSLVLSDGTGLASNYTVEVKTTTANINPKQITASYAATDKTYDGTTTATVSGSLSGVIAGDQVSVSTTGQFASANAASNIAVTASLTGNDAGNYTFTSSPVYATINALPIELSGAKIVDGSTTVSAAQLQAVNLIGNDTVTLSGSVGLAGSAAGVQSITSIALGSLGNSNYTLTGASGSVAVLSSYLPVLAPNGASTGISVSNPTAASLLVTQSTQTGIINWTSFNIAPGYSVAFNQPSATSITLNRIVGNELSVIAGTLTANGRLIFINSAGMLFSAGSTVNVGGIVASTQDITDANFSNDTYVFGSNNATGSIDVLGNITINQAGSYIALLGNGVAARGSITAPGGTIILAGGEGITLNRSGGGLSGFSIATADKAVIAGGKFDVSSTTGNGGVVATQGSSLSLNDNLQVKATGAATNGSWLIQTNGDLTIGNGGIITGAGLMRLLGQVNVTANANAVAASGNTASSAGNINVNDAVSWAANTLTLNAAGSIYVNNVMTASGTASFGGTYGTGTNADGSTQGLYTSFGAAEGTFAGKINFSGSGSVTLNGHVYQAIHSLDDLAAINGQSGYYYLANDLTDYLPYSSAVVAAFSGVLDGFGHVINNLTINDTSQTTANALIGTLSDNGSATAILRNIGLVNASITAQGPFVSGLVGALNGGIIGNDFVTGTVAGPFDTGGLVGIGGLYNSLAVARIENSYAHLTLYTGGNGGGLAGYDYPNVTIINSHATGSITATGSSIGGLIGLNAGTISNSWANVAINSNGGQGIGGFVGENDGLIYNGSYSLGNITGTNIQYVGGFVGINTGTIMGTIDGIDHGDAYYVLHPDEIADNYATGNVNVTITATSGNFDGYGGFFGDNFGRVANGVFYNGIIDYFYSTGNVNVLVLYPHSNVLISDVGGLGGLSQIGSLAHGTGYGKASCSGPCLDVDPNLIGNNNGDPVASSIQHIDPPPSPPSNGNSGNGSNANNATATTGPGTDFGATASIPNAGSGLGDGTSAGGTTSSSRGAQASQAGGAAAAALNGNGTPPELNSGPSANNSLAASLEQSLDAQISKQIPATTDVPVQKPGKDEKDRKHAANTQKKRPDTGFGASIRSIEINGQSFELQGRAAKDGGASKNTNAPSNAPKPSAPVPAEASH